MTRLRHVLALALSATLAPLTVGLQAQRTPAPPTPTATLYEIRFPNAVHHEAEVSIRFRQVPTGPLVVRMARSSPGRYAAHDFAKNVYNVKATDASGRALPVTRIEPNAWRVGGHNGEVRFSYTLFADRADGTYAGVDLTRAHLNIPATFAYAPALATRPIQATFVPPDSSWGIATQLQPTADPLTFRAPHLQYFMDSPTHLGPLDIRSWEVPGRSGVQTVRLAINHTGTSAEVDRFTEQTKLVVAEMAGVFGELPTFDFGSYTFIACYRATCAGDGMEHRNSTSLTSGASLAGNALGLLGTVSHEFFHAWNVERIRPAMLEPFDFSDANMSDELWFAEGFTNYYGQLVIARTGITPPTQYGRVIAGAVNTVTNHPGRRFFGPVGMSQQAPYVDAAASIDPNNRPNMFISYYTYGEAVALALDLTLRARTPAVTLDDVMRVMWRRFGPQTAALAPARGYRVSDVQAAVAEVTKDSVFARDFFTRYVMGSELPDYATLLARAGYLLRPANPNAAWIGDTRLVAMDGAVIVSGPTTFGSPMYEAGMDAGDRIVSVDGRAISEVSELRGILASKRPGDRLNVTWRARAGDRSAELTLRADPRLEIVAVEETAASLSAEQTAFRRAWLSSRSGSGSPQAPRRE